MTIAQHIASHSQVMCHYRSGTRSGDSDTVCTSLASYIYDTLGMPVCGQCASFINGKYRAAHGFFIYIERWTGTLCTGVQLERGRVVGPQYVLDEITSGMHDELHGLEYNGV